MVVHIENQINNIITRYIIPIRNIPVLVKTELERAYK